MVEGFNYICAAFDWNASASESSTEKDSIVIRSCVPHASLMGAEEDGQQNGCVYLRV